MWAGQSDTLRARHDLVDELFHGGTAADASSNELVGKFQQYIGMTKGLYLCKGGPLQAAASIGDEKLVTLFLDLHPDANAHARGNDSNAALQGTCVLDNVSPEGGVAEIEIAKRLLEHDTDVNRAPGMRGSNALQRAAILGDLDVAILLLQHGAEIQAPDDKDHAFGHGKSKSTALDLAASQGKLSMVKLHLDANGLGGLGGAIGYDSAIDLAHRNRHFAVADLIRAHAAKNKRLERHSPHLAQPQRSYRE